MTIVRRCLLQVTGALLLGAGVTAASVGGERFGGPTVTVVDGLLSVSLRDAAASEVFEFIGRQTGIRFVFYVNVDRIPLYISFEELPLDDGLRRLLHGMSYAFVFEEREGERALSEVFVMSNADSADWASDLAAQHRAAADNVIDSLASSGIREQVEDGLTRAGATAPTNPAQPRTLDPEIVDVLRRVLNGEADTVKFADRLADIQERLKLLAP